jgi:hypothetical protein
MRVSSRRAPSKGTASASALARHLERRRQIMDFTRGALLWLLGVPLPIILLIALFWHH